VLLLVTVVALGAVLVGSATVAATLLTRRIRTAGEAASRNGAAS